MCGLAGFIPFDKRSLKDMESIGSGMADAIFSRGPDDFGVWVEPSAKIALSFRRLAILDLSPAGHQPMESNSTRYAICFNGEIYNHLALRKILDLTVDSWRGHSDTETILAAFEKFGVEKAISMFVGMFSIAVWDKKYLRLTLARDRMGEKPLYYGFSNNAFIFGSELKALKKYPGFSNKISRSALANFIRYNYVPAPQSIYLDIFKLKPGHLVHIDYDSIKNKNLKPKKYWNLSDFTDVPQQDLISDSKEAFDLIKLQLSESVKSQMISDVPLGGFLSGGVDSSLIVSMMQENSMEKVKTFTIGFEDAGFDESPYAKEVALHLGTDHEEYFVTANETLNVIPQLPHIYDEPFADSSQIPTYLVCQEARRSVTVALSGDGGDEIFGGYNRYFWSSKIWSKFRWMPSSIRRYMGDGMLVVPDSLLDSIGGAYNFFAPKNMGINQFTDKVKKLGSRMKNVNSEDDLYISLITQWNEIDSLLISTEEEITTEDFLEPTCLNDSSSRMMFWDSLTYLPDDILCKVDRAAMAVSLETRTPFLDHRLVELAWRLDPSLKLNKSVGKIILRNILDDYVPKALIDRPKAGFGIPVGDWLRGPLKSWAEDLICEKRIMKEGFFNYPIIKLTWTEHLSGARDHTHKLWSILMFQSWLEAQ